jgi:hypothetical protein
VTGKAVSIVNGFAPLDPLFRAQVSDVDDFFFGAARKRKSHRQSEKRKKEHELTHAPFLPVFNLKFNELKKSG